MSRRDRPNALGYSSVLAIDVGTSSVKVVAVDPEGTVIGSSSSPTPGIEQGGLREIEAERWWDSAVSATRQLLHAVPSIRIDGIVLSGNMSSVVLVDGSGMPVRPAILVTDSRGLTQIEALEPALRHEIERRSSNPVMTSMTLGKLLWLADEELASLEQARSWLPAKDFVRLRLTDEIATEATDAANAMVLDETRQHWDLSLIERLGLPERIFPPLIDSGGIAGHLTPAAAEALGLESGVPVHTGLGDIAAAAFAADQARGEILVSLGTSTAMAVPVPSHIPEDWFGKVTVHPFAPGHGDFAMLSLLTGGLASTWLERLLGGRPEVGSSDYRFDSPLVFVPHLSGTGTPLWDDSARGSILGITPATSRREIYFAFLEALTIELADLLEFGCGEADISSLLLAGGLAQNDLLLQMVSDATGLPCRRPDTTEMSAYGAAMFAYAARGQPLPKDLGVRSVSPEPGRGAEWEQRKTRYRRIRNAVLAIIG